jgi:hypothetical protein
MFDHHKVEIAYVLQAHFAKDQNVVSALEVMVSDVFKYNVVLPESSRGKGHNLIAVLNGAHAHWVSNQPTLLVTLGPHERAPVFLAVQPGFIR